MASSRAHHGSPAGQQQQHSRRTSSYEQGMNALPFATARGFDILDWHPAYQSCQRYFLDHAQYEAATQALCALINIRLPFQWRQHPVYSSAKSNPPSGHSTPSDLNRQQQQQAHDHPPAFVSLLPFVRRLVVTGFDAPGILHGFFGDAWARGIGPLRECERRNYLFAAKSGGWKWAKDQYDHDGAPEEAVPFLQPLRDVAPHEIEAAEKSWSKWLALEDWMVGPRAPGERGLG